MNAKGLATGISIIGGIFGIVGGALGTYQTIDQIKNGVKLRDDQLKSLSDSISNNVSATIVDNYSEITKQIVAQMNNQTT